jgi:hypothetical protein
MRQRESIRLALTGPTFGSTTRRSSTLAVRAQAGGRARISGSPTLPVAMSFFSLARSDRTWFACSSARRRCALDTPCSLAVFLPSDTRRVYDAPCDRPHRTSRLTFSAVSAAERRALNENVFREMNERLERLGEEFGGDTVEFLCECADPACSHPLSIQVSLYEAVRDHPRWFVVVPGHEREVVERVVQEHPDCLVIEKVGEAGEVAEDTDPRP